MRCTQPASIFALSCAFAASACAASPTPPVAVIAYKDLDLRSPDQRRILSARIDEVVVRLCRKEADERRLGEHFNRFNPAWCMRPTRKSVTASLPASVGKI